MILVIDWSAIEAKWRKKWHDEKYFEAEPSSQKKFFVTVAYPYPNSPQHIGHGRTYTLADVHARFMRMRGYNVLFPMGFHYTGTPILGMARRIQENDVELIEAFKTLYKVPEQNIKEFAEPVKIADYFHQEIKSGMIEMGYSIDWRREFTTIDPVYNKFIEWQFKKLKSKNLVIQGSHPVGWCPKDQNPVSQHDTLGDVEPSFTEYILIKFRYDKYIIPTATLRPETIFGVTNLWINPNVTYKIASVNNETWIVSAECARKLEFLDKKVKIIDEINGSDLVGKKVKVPERNEEIIIFPASFVKSENGTGIVMSVPAHAPFDYQALEDIKETNNIDQNLLSLIKSIVPISIIQTEGYGEIPAKEVIEKFQIENQNNPKLEEATKELYAKEFYGGKLKQNTGKFAQKTVADAKEEVKKWILQSKNADILFELNDGPIHCRCGTECVVKLLNDQWFLDYSNKKWKDDTHLWINEMKILPEEIRGEFNYVVDWLRERACARQHGLGTKLPWDKDWIVESLSDSVIYMAYYILAKYVNKKQIVAENLGDEFFDYVFLGDGDSKKISLTCKISQDLLENIKNEFQYFYPVNARHSGRDLVPNHLTFFIFNHIAIFPKKYWPEEIVVNGSVLMEGKKMSKSMGNIIPLRDAIRTHGADPIRLAILISAELLQDADFNLEAVRGIKNKLENMLEECSKYKPGQTKNLEQEDRWLQSKLQQLVLEITSAMEKMRLREALHYVLYEFDSDIQWYLKRTESKRRKDIAGTLHEIFSARVAMLSPFAPYIAEEMWEKLGNAGTATKSLWPVVVENKIDAAALQSENLLKSTLEDIKNILKVTKISPKRIIIYTSDSWKTKAYQKILVSVIKGEMNIGVLMKSLIADMDTENVKKDPDFVKKTVNDILSEPVESREYKAKLGLVEEKKILLEIGSLVQKEFGVGVEVFAESDPQKYDPKNKARTARPFKPAILIE